MEKSTMMRSSLLSFFPKGFFGRPLPSEDQPESLSPITPVMETTEMGRKRAREEEEEEVSCCVDGSRTPTLIPPRRLRMDVFTTGPEMPPRATKRFRGEHGGVPAPLPDLLTSATKTEAQGSGKSDFLSIIPEDVVSHCLSFLGSVEDRFSLQTTSKVFRRISNTDPMLVNIRVGGDPKNGKNGIIQDDDTPAKAASALTPFARAGNLEAIYMLGMIKSYCYYDVQRGIVLLKMAASRGYVRSSYALGLVLRDSMPDEANQYMQHAATEGYIPALQEVLSAREMKAKFGEPNAEELRRHLDPLCLNRLLGRHYVRATDLRAMNTSHCWNPLCGRWAFKAILNGSGNSVRLRRPYSFAFYRPADADNPVVMVPAPAAHRPVLVGISHPTQQYSRDDMSTPTESPPTNESVAGASSLDVRVSRMKMCSRCCRAKYCSKLCQVYDWRSGRHKIECQFL